MKPDEDNSPVTLNTAPAEGLSGAADESHQTRLTHVQLIPYYALCLAVAAVPVITLLYFRSESYQDGLTFKKGLHVFGFMLQAGKSFLITATVLLIAVAGSSIIPKKVRARLSALFVVIFLISLVVSLSTFPACVAAFNNGRAKAYEGTNVRELVAACRVLHESYLYPKGEPIPEWFNSHFPSFSELPEFIQKLNPSDVYIGKRGVVLQMDGGGIAAHEAYFVPISAIPTSVDTYAQLRMMNIISRDPPVFWNSSYDCRSLPYD